MSLKVSWFSTPEIYTSAEADVTSAQSMLAENRRFSTTDVALTTLYIIISVLGLVSNSFVVVVIFQFTAMRKGLPNMFIINQSIVDGFASLILLLSTIFEDEGRVLAGNAGELYCYLWLTKCLLWGSLTTSTFNLVAVTLERFFAVVRPIKHKLFITRAKIMAVIIIVWLCGFAFNMVILLPTTRIIYGKCDVLRSWPSVLAQHIVGIFNICVKFVFPLSIMTYCYVKMAFVLKRRVHPVDAENNTNVQNSRSHKARQNIIKTLILVTVCYVICWSWNQFLFLIFNFGYKLSFTTPFYHFTVVAVYSNCCCNPFIYIANYSQFQNGVRKFKNRLLPRPHPID